MQEIYKLILEYILSHAGEIGVFVIGSLVAWLKKKFDIEKMGQRALDNGVTDQQLIEKIIGTKIKIRK